MWLSLAGGRAFTLLSRYSTSSTQRMLRRGYSCLCKVQPWRPSLDDVQRLSEGRAAKSRGTGSRFVPHRLNSDEAKLFKLAKEKGFLTIKGSGYRRERKGSPLANIYRQWCDATARPCIIVEQDSTGGSDTVLVDFSPLRSTQLQEEMSLCQDEGAQLGLHPSNDESRSPFTVDLLPEALDNLPGDLGTAAAEQEPVFSTSSSRLPEPDNVDEVALGATEVSTSLDPENGAVGKEARPMPGTAMLTAPIWRQAPQLLCFQADRTAAKMFAKQLSVALADHLKRRQ